MNYFQIRAKLEEAKKRRRFATFDYSGQISENYGRHKSGGKQIKHPPKENQTDNIQRETSLKLNRNFSNRKIVQKTAIIHKSNKNSS